MSVLSATVRVDGIPRVEVATDPQWLTGGGTLWRVTADGAREQVDGPITAAEAPQQHVLYASGTGRYDAFPVLASNGSTLVAMFRSATGHTADHAATAKVSLSTDGGRSWSVPTVAYDDGDALLESTPAGLVWDHVRSRWVAILVRKTYPDTTSNTATILDAMVLTSTDGLSWSVLVSKIPQPSSVAWWFPSSLAIGSDGAIVAGLYGRTSTAYSNAIVITSSDGGVTWTKRGDLGWPGANTYEPQVVQCPDGSWMFAANIGNSGGRILASYSADASSWSPLVSAVSGFGGQPALGVSKSTGWMLMLLRQPASDATHGLWSYAASGDNGRTWQVRSDFPEQSRYMMYGGFAETDEGLLCVYSSEDDPAVMWNGASIYWTMFRSAGVDSWVDYEAPRGVPFRYAVGRDEPSGPLSVQVPDHVGSWLIDRTDPSKSVRIHIDGEGLSSGSRDIASSTVQVMGSDTPVTVQQTRQRPSFSLAVHALTVRDYDALVACLNSPGPKLIRAPRSYWLMRPVDWVMIGAVGEQPRKSPGRPAWTFTLPLTPTAAPAVVDRQTADGQSWYASKSWRSARSWLS